MIYLDSSIFLSAALYDPKASASASRARAALKRLPSGEIEACTATLTWDEVVWTVRRLVGAKEALDQGRALLRLPRLRLLSVDSDALARAQEIAEEDHLKPRDAIHAAVALNNGVRDFMSFDGEFSDVRGVRRIEP